MTATTHVTDAAGFIAAICADPDDDVSRKVYADWLDERDDPRGELIHRMYAIHHRIGKNGWTPRETVHYGEISDLLAEHGGEWALPEVYGGLRRGPNDGGLCVTYRWPMPARYPVLLPEGDPQRVKLEFRRGFVERILCPTSDWLTYGPVIVRSTPLIEVRLTDRRHASLLLERESPPHQDYKTLRSQHAMWYSSRSSRANDSPEATIPHEVFSHLSMFSGYPHNRLRVEYLMEDITTTVAYNDLSRAAICWARGPHEGLEALPPWEPKV